MQKAFVLCDPNIVKIGGHYLEYAKMVFEKAEKRGYRLALAVNEQCQVEPQEGWTILPVFEYGFWGRHLGTDVDPAFTEADRRFLRLYYSRYGLLWSAAGMLGEVQHFNRGYPPSADTVRRLGEMRELRSLTELFLQSKKARDGAGDRAPEDWTPEDRERSYAVFRHALRAAFAALKDKTSDERARLAASARSTSADAARDVAALEDLTGMARRAESFARAMRRVLDTVRPGPDSMILYPTINYFELRGLKTVLDDVPEAGVASHHVILRRNVYNGYCGSFDEQEWLVHPMRTALALLNDIAPDVRLRFYTDTEPLTHQYNLFGTAKFTTGPVPVDMVDRARRKPPAQGCEGLPTLLLADVGEIEEARGFLEQLEAGTRTDDRLEVKLVVRGASPLGAYLAAGLQAPRSFGPVEFILPEDVDGLRAEKFGLLAFATWYQNYTRLAQEGMEQGRPLAVSPSSWLAGTMCEEAASFHDVALERAVTLEILHGASLPWMEYDYATCKLLPIGTADRLGVRSGAAATVELAIPAGADSVRMLFRQVDSGSLPGAVHLIAFFRSEANPGVSIGRHDLILNSRGGIASVVFPVPAGCSRFSLALCNFTTDVPLQVEPLQAFWLKAGGQIPALPGGLLLPRLQGDFVNSWLTPLRNLRALYQAYGASGAAWMDPVALRRRVLPGQRPMMVSYLGDAREEKGFHRLPNLVTSLGKDVAGQDIVLKSQVYYTSAYPEASCLKAAAILRTAPRDRVTLIERPLDSCDYAREILKSDAILIPYRHHDYIARSSGIFSEALAGGIPVVIPSATWMSAELDAITCEHHHRMIHKSRLIDAGPIDLHSFVGGQVHPLQRRRPVGNVPISRGSITFLHMPVPDEVDYLWMTYRPDPVRPRAFTRFDISFQDASQGGKEIRKVKRVSGGGIAKFLSVLTRIPKRAQGVWIGMYNANGFECYDLQNFSMKFVSATGQRIPEFVGGIAYFTGDDDAEMESNIAEAVLQLRREYDLYAASAAAIQPEWAERHTPSRLVELMEKPFTADEQVYRTRFHGADW